MNHWSRVALCALLVALLLTGCQKAPVTPPTATQQPTKMPAPTTTVTPSPSPQVEERAIATPPVEPSPTAAAPTPPDLPPIAEGLQGLDIDTFFEQSYTRIGTRYPEYITTLGLSDALGVRKDQLNDMSNTFIRETQALEKAILALLKTYDRAALTPEQHLSYDVYLWYLEDQIRGREFVDYDYIIRPGAIGYQDTLVQFFTDLYPLANRTPKTTSPAWRKWKRKCSRWWKAWNAARKSAWCCRAASSSG